MKHFVDTDLYIGCIYRLIGVFLSTTEVVALDRRFWEAWNKGKETFMKEMDEICAPDVVFHGWFGRDYGLDDHKQHGSEFFTAFPDLHWTIDEMLPIGDKVVVRYAMTGINKGSFRGMPPTNKTMIMWGVDIHRFVRDKLVECWSRMDTMGFMNQLGFAPKVGKEK